jgi:wobble nucleotide-excising tRNase
VQANELIAAYRSYFNAAYRRHKQEVARLPEQAANAIGDASLDRALQAIAANAALVEFWGHFTSVDLPAISLQEIQRKYATLREKCLALAGKKQVNPIDAVVPDADFAAALAAVGGLEEVVASYNSAVDEANARVSELKAAVRSEGDIAELEHELAELKARKRRFELDAAQACKAYEGALAAKADLEQGKEKVRKQLDRHCSALLRTYEQCIDEYLDQFNAGFRITNTRHLYTGGTPSSQYQIEINSTALDLGDRRTPSGTRCFKTALSSGDRSALALAFFLAALKRDSDIGRKIVVFDDPFTSMDSFRRVWTQQAIRRVFESAEQVIVLSHEADFLNGIRVGVPEAHVKTLQMRPFGRDNMVIAEWDIEAATLRSYESHYRNLVAYKDTRNGEPLDVAKAIRPFLEELYRVRFPAVFLHGDDFGVSIEKAKQAINDGTLQLNQAEVDELSAINEYARRFHHGQSPTVSPDELYGYVKRALRLTGGR